MTSVGTPVRETSTVRMQVGARGSLIPSSAPNTNATTTITRRLTDTTSTTMNSTLGGTPGDEGAGQDRQGRERKRELCGHRGEDVDEAQQGRVHGPRTAGSVGTEGGNGPGSMSSRVAGLYPQGKSMGIGPIWDMRPDQSVGTTGECSRESVKFSGQGRMDSGSGAEP